MARTTKKNDRCPFKDTCEQKCEWKNKEIECDYYRYNACPGKEIEDQEELREQYAAEHYAIQTKESVTAEHHALEINGPTEKGGIVYLPIEKLIPHKHNPRKDLGDLTELADSIKVKGVLQNLTVVPDKKTPDQYIIVIGHRRCAAAKIAGLTELPCAIVDMDDKEQIETMLLENIQRSDLNALEQAEGFQLMFDMGQSVDKISAKTGFSKTTVRKRLQIAKLDPEKVAAAVSRQVTFGDFDKLNEIESIDERNKLLDKMGTNNFTYELEKAKKQQERDKKAAEWGKILAPHARPLNDVKKEEGAESNAFACILTLWDKEPSFETFMETLNSKYEGKEIPTELFYATDTDWALKVSIYCRATPTVETPEEQAKKDAAAEREEKLKELGEKISEANGNAYAARYKFIKEWTMADGLLTKDELYKLCLATSLENLIGQYCDIVAEEFADLCGIKMELPPELEDEDNDFSESDLIQEIVEQINGNLPIYKTLLVHAYLSMEDDERLNDNGGRYDGFKYNPSAKLEAIYNFLEKIGYEMSDEEEALHDGSFVKELKEEMGLTE